jgi:hypothetical protein
MNGINGELNIYMVALAASSARSFHSMSICPSIQVMVMLSGFRWARSLSILSRIMKSLPESSELL